MSAMKALLEITEQAERIGVILKKGGLGRYANSGFTVHYKMDKETEHLFMMPNLESTSYLLDMLEQKILIPKTHGIQPPIIKAHVHLVRYALEKGHSIFVDDGGELFVLEDCTDEKQILEAIDAVELSEIVIFANGKQIGWAQIIDQGEPTETIVNYTMTEFMIEWDKVYDKLTEGV
jgi:hypothetical protein